MTTSSDEHATRNEQQRKDETLTATTCLKSNFSSRETSDTLQRDCHGDDSTTTSNAYTTVLGIPPWLNKLQKGESLYALRNCNEENNKEPHAYSIERISTHPPIFILRNVLTGSECHEIYHRTIDNPTSRQAQTLVGASARPNSNVVWLQEYDDVATSVAETCISNDYKKNVWVESLQALHYTPQGKYSLHHDGHERILTCLYYINGVGGTWFPLACSISNGDNLPPPPPSSREQALQRAQDCIPGKNGVLIVGKEEHEDMDNTRNGKHVIRINKGDAVVFYNYLVDETSGAAVSDWTTLHAGLLSSQDKIIANHWFHLGNDE